MLSPFVDLSSARGGGVVDDCTKRVVGGADVVGVQSRTWETGAAWCACAWKIRCWYDSFVGRGRMSVHSCVD